MSHKAEMLTAPEFATKWSRNTRNERAACQEHFIDLCRLLHVPTPNEADPDGETYAFEKGASKTDGRDGFADVWKKGFFAWEYKGKQKDLAAAYSQLLQYREALENPPLLIVSDLNRFELHTNFTNTQKHVEIFELADFMREPERPLRLLRAVMNDPEQLRPNKTREQITEQVASEFATLAQRMQKRGHDTLAIARFLNRLVFCLFAEDTGLLPKSVLGEIFGRTRKEPHKTEKLLGGLFAGMARGGGFFGAEEIQWFNGGLFDDAEVLPLKEEDINLIREAARLDWSSVEPAVLGTLFERGLDPDKRGQLGAHYTDKESILRVIEPVLLVPLRREYHAMQKEVTRLISRGKRATAQAKGRENPNRVFRAFLARLRSVRVLDPACGSGNFLYLSLRALKDLEKEAIVWGSQVLHTTMEIPAVGPQCVTGIEINSYAAELARIAVWIGEIQWMIQNGFSYRTNPILRPLQTIECRDALLDTSSRGSPKQAVWPDTEFIVGNPPFLGGKKLRKELKSNYVDGLFAAWEGDVPREADYVCYWHEKARQMIETRKCKRAGLLATQGIRGGANQLVLKRIKETGDIFCGWSDLDWVVEGANVRVSTICQDNGSEQERTLDGKQVQVIHADLTGGERGALNLTVTKRLAENLNVAFMGDTKGGKFEIPAKVAEALINAPTNVNGRQNIDVVRPWINGFDIARRGREMYIIDFGVSMSEAEASRYQAPFEFLRKIVKGKRTENRRAIYAKRWWIHAEPRPRMRAALAPLKRFLVTPRVAKHRIFAWLDTVILPDSATIVIARDDWYAFGVLHSKVHEAWGLALGTHLEDRPRYTPTSTFETFPFPWPLDTLDSKLTPSQMRQRDAIAAASKALEEQRFRWLNPPEFLKTEAAFAPGLPKRHVPKDAAAADELKNRTLTSLYNARPTWLDIAHRALDEAVLAAYGFPAGISERDLLARLLKLNHERSASADLAADAPLLTMATEKEEDPEDEPVKRPKFAKSVRAPHQPGVRA